MKNASLLAAAIFASACASTGMRGNLQPTPSDNSDSSAAYRDSLLQKSGLLDFGISEFYTDTVEVRTTSASAKFTKLVPLLGGDDLRKMYQPAELNPGDTLIAINGTLLGYDNAKLEKLPELYKSNTHAILSFIDAKDGELKNIVANDGHSFGDITFRTSDKQQRRGWIRIDKVAPGSWAERSGFQAGDLIVSPVHFSYAEVRKGFFLRYSMTEFPEQTFPVSDAMALRKTVEYLFQDVKPYRPVSGSRDGLLKQGGLFRFWVLRDYEKLVHLDMMRSQYVGLGVQFDCRPFCGKAKPVIRAIFPDSTGARAGFAVNDLLISVNGHDVNNSWAASKQIQKLNYGDMALCRVLRDGRIVDIEAPIGWVFEN